MPRKKVVKKSEPDADRIEAAVEDTEDTKVEETPEQGQSLEDLKIAYVVGLSQDGNFVFELFGTDKGLVELMGIHQHAESMVRRVYEDAQVTGDRLTHEVGKAVTLVNQKLDTLIKALQPKAPDNTLPGSEPNKED